MVTLQDILKHHKDLIEQGPCIDFRMQVDPSYARGFGIDSPVYYFSFGYFKNGMQVYHQENGPARLFFSADQHKPVCMHYYQHGELHRTDGPSSYWYHHTGVVTATEYNIGGRHHREDGPAQINTAHNLHKWFLQGVEVTEQIVLRPHTLNRETIMDIKNIEVRRIAIDRYGLEKFFGQMDVKDIIHKRIDPISGIEEKLIFLFNFKRQLWDGTTEILPVNALICYCPSTARSYAVQIPADVKTCQEAQAWLKGPRLQDIEIIGAS